MKIDEVWPEWSAIGEPIGHGSYGVVYKCVCHEDNEEKYSAIKVISVPQDDINYSSLSAKKQESIKAEYKEIVDGFLNEIKILETLKGNKNIVAIEDSKVVEREEGIGWQIFIRMELLTDLEEYMEKNTFEKEDILRLGIDLCQALKACGEKKIIHRDIKPKNIFVDGEGNFKLGDFGVAKQLEKTMSSMSMKGTYEYISPEVIQHKKDVSKADIYSLAMVMYKLFNNNRLPFLDTQKQIITYGEREAAVKKRFNGGKIPTIKDVDENINRVLIGALKYKAEDRLFKSIEDFEKSLNRIVGGKRIWKKIKKKPILFSTVSILLVASIIIGIFTLFHNRKNDTEEGSETTVSNQISEKEEKNEVDKENENKNKEKKEEKIKIKYSGMCNGIYTYDKIDYCAGYDGKFCKILPNNKKEILSEQRVATEFTIIDDKIYYTVINKTPEKKFYPSYNAIIEWADCSTWVMDLNGKNKKKIFNYNGSGCVIWADKEDIYYFEDPIPDVYLDPDIYGRLLKKYSIKEKKSTTIISKANTGFLMEELSDPDYQNSYFYSNGYIICGGISYGGKVYRFDIKKKNLKILKIKTKCSFFMLENGKIYFKALNDSYPDSLVEYNTINDTFKTVISNCDYCIVGVFDNKILMSEYHENGDKYFFYNNGKIEEIKNLFGTEIYYANQIQKNEKGMIVFEGTVFENNDSSQYAWKISLINDKTKKVIKIVQGKFEDQNEDLFMAFGSNIILFIENSYDNIITATSGTDIPDINKTEKIKIFIPYLLGTYGDDAEEYLKFLGIKTNVNEEYSDEDEGKIFNQSIDSSTKVDYGSKMTITVSKGLEERKFVLEMPKEEGIHKLKVEISSKIIEYDKEYLLDGSDYAVWLKIRKSYDGIYFVVNDEFVSTEEDIYVYIDDSLYGTIDYSAEDDNYNTSFY